MFSGKHEIIVVCLSRQLTSQVGSFAPPSEEIFSPPFLYIVQREFNIQAQPLLPSSVWEILQFLSCFKY
jgi:hypothetical protein